MRRAVLVVLLAGAVAHADGWGASMTLVTGPRYNAGRLGDYYTWGWLTGVEAAVQPSIVGLVWTMAAAVYRSSSDTNPSSTYNSFEMDLGLRFRFPLKPKAATAVPAYFFLDSTLNLVRSTFPDPTTNKQAFVGPAISLGTTVEPWSSVIFGLRAGYGLLLGGPAGLQIMFSIGYGKR